jgi:hypothetical protein
MRRAQKVSSIEEQVKNIINEHTRKMKKENKKHPGFRETKTYFNKLLQADVLKRIQSIVAEEFSKSRGDGQHHWRIFFAEDLFVTISIIPTFVHEVPSPQHFDYEYTEFLNLLVNAPRIRWQTCVMHWIFFCLEENIYNVKATILLNRGHSIVAQDLITEEEMTQVPICSKPKKSRPSKAGSYSMVKGTNGQVCGLWLGDSEIVQKKTKILGALLAKHNLLGELGSSVLTGDYRIVTNTFDNAGGCFVMFGSMEAPGEPLTPTPRKQWWQF